MSCESKKIAWLRCFISNLEFRQLSREEIHGITLSLALFNSKAYYSREDTMSLEHNGQSWQLQLVQRKEREFIAAIGDGPAAAENKAIGDGPAAVEKKAIGDITVTAADAPLIRHMNNIAETIGWVLKLLAPLVLLYKGYQLDLLRELCKAFFVLHESARIDLIKIIFSINSVNIIRLISAGFAGAASINRFVAAGWLVMCCMVQVVAHKDEWMYAASRYLDNMHVMPSDQCGLHQNYFPLPLSHHCGLRLGHAETLETLTLLF